MWVKNKLKLNPLLVCCSYPPKQMTKIGAKNIENLLRKNFEILTLTPSPKSSASFILESFTKFGNVCKSTELALFSTVPRIASDLGINLIFGERILQYNSATPKPTVLMNLMETNYIT